MVDKSLTALNFIAAVSDFADISDVKYISMMGEGRHKLTINKLELALTRENLISQENILKIKSTLSGVEANYGLPEAIGILPMDVSRRTGALVINENPLEVVMVDPKESLIKDVEASLGRVIDKVKLTTAKYFIEVFSVIYSGTSRDSSEEIKDPYSIFDEAVTKRASDIHLSVGQPPVLRIDGQLIKLNYKNLTHEFMEKLILELGGDRRLDEVKSGYQSDFAYPFGVSRFRCNAGMSSNGLTLAARRLPSKVPTQDELHLPASIRRFGELERGLVLVTGPTGSGKSTTLAAILGHIANNSPRHIITLEDPIEFVLPDKGEGHVDQRELGSSFSSFPQGLRQALRQDPDVILVGELRDWETMATALSAAETGHLVFGTLHTSSAEQTIGRLVSAAPAEEQDQVRAALAYILKGVVSQVLIPALKGDGRVAAFEVLVSNPAIANNLRRIDGAAAIRQIMESSSSEGMQIMDMALAELVNTSKISLEEAAFRSRDLSEFNRRLRHS